MRAPLVAQLAERLHVSRRLKARASPAPAAAPPAAVPSDDGGFGLVELVVAMGVVGVIGTVLALGMGESLSAAAVARQRAVATGLVSAADAQIQAATAGSLAGLQPSPASTVVDGTTYCTSYAVSTSGSPSQPLYTFAITVTWPGCSGSSSLARSVEAGGT